VLQHGQSRGAGRGRTALGTVATNGVEGQRRAANGPATTTLPRGFARAIYGELLRHCSAEPGAHGPQPSRACSYRGRYKRGEKELSWAARVALEEELHKLEPLQQLRDL
jgi:hypothetical protein